MAGVVSAATVVDVGRSLNERGVLILELIAVCVAATLERFTANAVAAGAIFKVMSPPAVS